MNNPSSPPELSITEKALIARLKHVNVMVVDSNEKSLNLMVNILKKLGFSSIFTASDGFAAVDLMLSDRKKTIDIIITDWELQPQKEVDMTAEKWRPIPPKDGASFVKYLRRSSYPLNPFIAIIMLSGLALQRNVEYARDSGASEILVKPVDAQELCNRISSVINDDRYFITALTYRGPCRRRSVKEVAVERRKCDIRVYKHRS